MRFVRELPELGDHRTGLLELGLGEVDLAREAVQVAHGRAHDLAPAPVGRALDLREHRAGDVVGTAEDHWPDLRQPPCGPPASQEAPRA